jgi:GDP-L-fucose synthase
MTVWGSGLQMRDFIHIEDCLDGILATMDQVEDASAFNLSTGIYTSFTEFATIAADLCGYVPEITCTSDKPEGVFARGGDTGKQRAHGFTPRISFREGVAKALRYYESLTLQS